MSSLRSLTLPGLLVLLAPVLSGALAAQGPDASLESVREFKRFFRRYKHTAERVAAVQTLEDAECREAVDTLMDLLDHREPEVQVAAMQVLCSFRDPEPFAGLLEELPELKKTDDLSRAVEIVGCVGLRDALPALHELATRDRTGAGVKAQVARALGRLGSAVESAGPLGALLREKDAGVRLAALEAAAALRAADLTETIIELLGDSAWQVRSGAAAALGTLRQAAAIAPLIELMRETGRLKEDAAEALFAITALDFGTDPDMWARQWTKLQKLGWKVPTDEDLAKAAAARERNEAYYGPTEHSDFVGIKTSSKRVLFIIDVSGSMDDTVVETERFDAGYEDLRKLTIAKTELVRTIDGLGQDTYFNVVAFASELKTWKSDLVVANIINKSSAKAWSERLKPLGGREAIELANAGLVGTANLGAGKTNTFAALMSPFGIKTEKYTPNSGPVTRSRRWEAKNALDTVFFLSDGRPTTGALVDEKEILAEIDRINEVHRIVFHAIAIGDFQKGFLRQLAEANGGVFVDLGR
ncbi:MAG: HEAT repeat domain-containing protein [Planctomycetota bacterium]